MAQSYDIKLLRGDRGVEAHVIDLNTNKVVTAFKASDSNIAREQAEQWIRTQTAKEKACLPHSGGSLVNDPPEAPTASKAAIKLAQEKGIKLEDIPHDGNKINKPDVDAYIKSQIVTDE